LLVKWLAVTVATGNNLDLTTLPEITSHEVCYSLKT
tara:strand:+ start:4252 stop:4359 length:108 start_codon:yes stop_codon:yes gene_type:complete